jgi:Tol biopolymer transport system component
VSTNAEDRTVAANVLTLRPDGSDVRQITNDVGPSQRAAFASYSPDGQWILFRQRLGDERALFRVRPDGTDLHQLTPWSEFVPLEADWGPAPR